MGAVSYRCLKKRRTGITGKSKGKNRNNGTRRKQGIRKLKTVNPQEKLKITNELLKQLQIFILKIGTTNRIPEDWTRGIMLMFYKKWDRKDPNNYREINLKNTILKLARMTIIATTVNERISLWYEQQEFMSERLYTDVIFITRRIKFSLKEVFW